MNLLRNVMRMHLRQRYITRKTYVMIGGARGRSS